MCLMVNFFQPIGIDIFANMVRCSMHSRISKTKAKKCNTSWVLYWGLSWTTSNSPKSFYCFSIVFVYVTVTTAYKGLLTTWRCFLFIKASSGDYYKHLQHTTIISKKLLQALSVMTITLYMPLFRLVYPECSATLCESTWTKFLCFLL